MKKVLVILVIVVLSVTFLWFLKKYRQDKTKTLGTYSETTLPWVAPSHNSLNFEFEGTDLAVLWVPVTKPENLYLIPNFSEKLTSGEVFEKNTCEYLVSSGFYSKDEKPLGLFISDREKISDWQKNSLLNGVFSINDFEVPRITSDVPDDPLRIAIQSGPILKENGSFIPLSLKNDSPERRVVAAATGENQAIFLVIYDRDSVFLGPHLESLPKVLSIFEEMTGFEFADAINLDGGTASAYVGRGIKLPEVSNVGSFFCERRDN